MGHQVTRRQAGGGAGRMLEKSPQTTRTPTEQGAPANAA